MGLEQTGVGMTLHRHKEASVMALDGHGTDVLGLLREWQIAIPDIDRPVTASKSFSPASSRLSLQSPTSIRCDTPARYPEAPSVVYRAVLKHATIII